MPVEFINPNRHEVHLRGPDNTIITLTGNEKRVMPDYFRRYVPRYLKVLRENVVAAIPRPQSPHSYPKMVIKRPAPVIAKPPQHFRQPGRTPAVRPQRPMVVGKVSLYAAQATEYYNRLVGNIIYPISNDVGVGILSFNRIHCLHRLILSIRAHTDLSRTTVFISDESTNPETKDYLTKIPDMVVLPNQPRLGIAGNTNRLLRCLSRFKYKIILNDDVEILRPGWDSFYATHMKNLNAHHFCARQAGVYGASDKDGKITVVNGVSIRTITEKPQGAVMAFDDLAFSKVGYFDESFGIYGMEHVDWSDRVSKSGIQGPGFHDIVGSGLYFKIYAEDSSTEDRSQHLSQARKTFEELKTKSNRLYVSTSDKTQVPSVSYIIPYRGSDRTDCIKTVIQNIKAQRYPEVDIVCAEQDDVEKVVLPEMSTVTHVLAKSLKPGDPFTKSVAFNLGVKTVKYDKIFLHDADMLIPAHYTAKAVDILATSPGLHIGHNVLYLSQASTTGICSTQKVVPGFKVDRTVGYFEGGTLACTRDTYLRIGGFNEEFVGYGCEDCEFFFRLAKVPNFCNQRTEDLIHLWHGRTPGWMEFHKRNKEIEKRCYAANQEMYMTFLRKVLHDKYGI